MMPAAKFMDPVMGIDIHLIQPPGPVPPLPIPHPFVGMLYDPMELAPFVGATVFVNGMPKATAGSEGKAVPPHIPIGGVFVPPPPGNECEMFMGSATVLFEGEPASYTALPALSCQSVGMPAPFRPKKKPKPIMKLPLSVVVPIPAGPPVLIGGPPTISLTVIGMKILMGAAGKAAKKLKKAMKASKKVKKVSDKIHKAANKAMKKLGVPPSVQNKVHKGICTVTGHPVDVATGKVFTDNLDFDLPGPIPLKWERTWFSTSTYDGPLGHGWHHGYDMALAEENGAVAIRMADGRPAAFPMLSAGGEYFDRIEKLTLKRDASGYVLVGKDGDLYRFASAPKPDGTRPLVSISTLGGHRILFAYDEKGRLSDIQDSGGRRLRIQNDGQGRILAVHAPHPEDKDRALTMVTYAYDGKGDLVEARDALGHPWIYQYRNHLLARETNRNGVSFHFEYQGTDDKARCLRTWGDGGIYDHKLTYDPQAGVTVVEDSLGHKIEYHAAPSGLVTSIRNALGGVSEVKFNEFNEPIERTDALGQKTAYAYDDRGNCLRVERPDGTALEAVFEDGRQTAVKDPTGAEWKWEYDEYRRVSKRIDPLGGITEYRYAGPNLASVVDPSGRESKISWDGNRNLTALATDDGSVSRWEYDLLGRRTAEIAPDGSLRRFQSDLGGRAIRVEEQDGNVLEIVRDPEGNTLKARDRHNTVAFRYRGINKMVARESSGSKVEFQYDTEERLIEVRNELGQVHRIRRGPAGDVDAEEGFDGIARNFLRDAKGRLLKILRPGEAYTEYVHDAMDRVVLAKHSDGEVESYTYREDGEVLEAANDEARITFERDILGRVVKEIHGDDWIESKFDPMGMRVAVSSSLGLQASIERNVMGDVAGFAIGGDGKAGGPAWQARFDHDLLGREIGRQLPGGLESRWTRDLAGRPIRHSLVGPSQPLEREFRWDVSLRLKAVIDSVHGVTLFGHDQEGNLAWSKGPDGAYQFRLPDAANNLYRSDLRSDREYGPGGRLRESRSTAGTTRFEYDPEGNLARKRMPNGKEWRYHWKVSGALSKVEMPDGETVEFAYDPLGRRIAKKSPNRVTRWIWDGNQPLHEWTVEGAGGGADRKAPSDAVITWLFKPETHAPMAKITSKEKLSIITDDNGVPLSMRDGKGHETWSARLDSYGEATQFSGRDEDCPFRFPGQYEDSETGLYYNRFRYYDPEAGRYISQDPLGIHGGLGLYNYPYDPLVAFDPLGLIPVYRNLRPDEDPTKGLSAKKPGRGMTPAGHVRNGSKESFKGSQFISTTTDPKVAETWRKEGQTTVMFDTDDVVPDDAGNLSVVDISDPEKAKSAGLKGPAAHYAKNSKEVLVEGKVPPDKIKKVCPK